MMANRILIAGFSGAAIGLSLVALIVHDELGRWGRVGWWLWIASLFVPCVANALLGAVVNLRGLRSEWLLILPLVPLWPLVVDGPGSKSDVFLIPAVVVWLCGIVGSMIAGRHSSETFKRVESR